MWEPNSDESIRYYLEHLNSLPPDLTRRCENKGRHLEAGLKAKQKWQCICMCISHNHQGIMQVTYRQKLRVSKSHEVQTIYAEGKVMS